MAVKSPRLLHIRVYRVAFLFHVLQNYSINPKDKNESKKASFELILVTALHGPLWSASDIAEAKPESSTPFVGFSASSETTSSKATL